MGVPWVGHIVFVEATVTGAGLRAVQFAKEKGLTVTFLTRNRQDYQPKDPREPDLLDLVDQVIDVETHDVEEVSRAALGLNEKMPITALTTVADFFVPQAAAAAERLGLPTIPYRAAVAARNKHLTRAMIARQDPDLNPAWALAGSEGAALAAAADIGYPLVIKPQDENDGFDIRRLDSPAQLAAEFCRITAKATNRVGQRKAPGGVILESLLQGQEYSVETLQGGVDEPVQLIGITKKYLTGLERGCFVEVGHCFPVDEHRDLILAAVTSALHALGVNTAICHTEVKVHEGRVKIVEVNPRLAGGRIGSHLIEIATGVNPVRLAIDCALGMRPRWNGVARQGAAIHNIGSPQQGRVRSLPDISHFEHPDVLCFSLPLRAGQEVQPPLSNGDLLGYVITRGATAGQAFRLARSLADAVSLDID